MSEQLSETWHPKYPDGCTTCGRTDRVHYSGGRCSTCYNTQRNERIRNQIEAEGIWYPGYPDGCTQCGRTDRKHVSGGRCSTCYTQHYRGGAAGEERDEVEGAWHRLYPEGCAQCGRRDRVHVSGGRCSTCYNNYYRRGIGADGEAPEPALDAVGGAQLASAPAPRVVGAFSGAVLEQLSTPTLLASYRDILQELRRREVLRTGNAPTGDYAEYLVCQMLGGTLAPNSEKSFDVTDPDGRRYQVKSRVVDGPIGKRALSPFRSWDFDEAVIVLFNDDYSILRAVRLPAETLQAKSTLIEHVNGNVVNASDVLLALGDDVTFELREVVADLMHAAE